MPCPPARLRSLSLDHYLHIFSDAFIGYARWLAHETTHPHLHNYVYWLLGVSLVVFGLELVRPWREDQGRFRRDFWLDAFYLVFNFFLFSLIGYAALSETVAAAFNDLLAAIGIDNLVAVEIASWPVAAQLAAMFVLRDFIHWNVHRLLHRVPRLWEFHKVHHSVREMGFAAHLRYHWAETIVYRTLEYIPLAMLGFGLDDFFIVHIVALTIGHLNHANFALPIGPLRYLFNSPQMHIWHHARELPRPHGVNFGISLSLWDWLFGTAYWPSDGRDIELGFDDIEEFPDTLPGQLTWGLRPRRRHP